jgi:mannitol/fructose-specific phosphotransferase system IIA component (Ntr-type)
MHADLMPNAATQFTLANFTSPQLVVPRLRQCDTAGIISELSQVLQRHNIVPDVLPFYHAALNQELLVNSALGCGLAFPHARSSGIKQLHFAFGRAPQPVTWGAKGSWPVQFIFLLAVPATDAAQYLHLLAGLARLGQQTELLGELRGSETVPAVLGVLERIKLRPG